MQSESGLMSNTGSVVFLYFQMDPQMPDPGSLLSQSMVLELCFRKLQPFWLIISKKSYSAKWIAYCKLPLFSVHLHAVYWWNIEAKPNRFRLSTVLVGNQKRVNVARYSAEDNVIGWWGGRPRQIGQGIPTPLLGGGSDARFERIIRRRTGRNATIGAP